MGCGADYGVHSLSRKEVPDGCAHEWALFEWSLQRRMGDAATADQLSEDLWRDLVYFAGFKRLSRLHRTGSVCADRQYVSQAGRFALAPYPYGWKGRRDDGAVCEVRTSPRAVWRAVRLVRVGLFAQVEERRSGSDVQSHYGRGRPVGGCLLARSLRPRTPCRRELDAACA